MSVEEAVSHPGGTGETTQSNELASSNANEIKMLFITSVASPLRPHSLASGYLLP